MKRTIFSLALIGLLAWTANAACTLDITKSPTIRGFKLGMTKEQIGKKYPDIKISDYSNTIWTWPGLMHPKTFDNVSEINFGFSGAVLAAIRVSYSTIEIDQQADFVASVAKSLNLPTAGWKFNTSSNDRLDCKGFTVFVSLKDHSIYLSGYDSFPMKSTRKTFTP